MNYNILLYKHKLQANIFDDLLKVKEYFAKHNIDISIKVEDTDVKKGDAILKLMIPNDGKYDVVMYMYEKNLFSAPTFGLAFNVSKTLRGIFLASDLVNDGADYTWKSICHELMHTLFYKFDIASQDPMDGMVVNNVWKPYHKNEDLDAPDGNFAEAFKRLEKYMKPIPTVTITRKSDSGKETLGDLVMGSFKCKTLELSDQGNLPNISCIPKGTYQCKYSFSPKFLKYTYEVLNVPKRSGIRIHSGNFFFDIQGCILLGTGYANLNNDKEVDIVNSRITIKKFEEKLGKKPFLLQIM